MNIDFGAEGLLEAGQQPDAEPVAQALSTRDAFFRAYVAPPFIHSRHWRNCCHGVISRTESQLLSGQ